MHVSPTRSLVIACSLVIAVLSLASGSWGEIQEQTRSGPAIGVLIRTTDLSSEALMNLRSSDPMVLECIVANSALAQLLNTREGYDTIIRELDPSQTTASELRSRLERLYKREAIQLDSTWFSSVRVVLTGKKHLKEISPSELGVSQWKLASSGVVVALTPKVEVMLIDDYLIMSVETTAGRLHELVREDSFTISIAANLLAGGTGILRCRLGSTNDTVRLRMDLRAAERRNDWSTVRRLAPQLVISEPVAGNTWLARAAEESGDLSAAIKYLEKALEEGKKRPSFESEGIINRLIQLRKRSKGATPNN